jgi:hypothetical protein
LQVPPGGPQLVGEIVTQSPMTSRQVDALHTQECEPLSQISLVTQTSQAPPAEPQAPVVLPGWHTSPAQQPLGHELASHLQVPLPSQY